MASKTGKYRTGTINSTLVSPDYNQYDKNNDFNINKEIIHQELAKRRFYENTYPRTFKSLIKKK